MDIERDGNLIEAGVWFVCALAVLVQAMRDTATLRKTLFTLAGSLALFGASDLVEARTGAWWRPWWLLVWKSACVIVLAAAFIRYFQIRKGKG